MRKARTNLNSLDNAMNKSTKDIERIIELRLVGKTQAQKMVETSKTIDWIRKKGKGAVERGVEVLIEIEKAIEEENDKLQKEE